MLKLWVLFGCLFTATDHVILVTNDAKLPFVDTEADFAPSVNERGIRGTLSVAEPLDACSPLTNKIVSSTNDTRYPFVLIIEGGCRFDEKVRRAQAAGFQAAVIYNTGYPSIAMTGNSTGIKINAVSVSRGCGETMKKYAGVADMEIWIVRNIEQSTWPFVAIAVITSAVVIIGVIMLNRRIRREQLRSQHAGMSSHLVKALPSLIFTADNCNSTTCAICLEDYNVGEKIRILPCHHKFHAICVDAWLTSWRSFCPVCKRDARCCILEPPPSESTPLLSPSPSPISSAPLLSSIRSKSASSSASQSVSSPRSISRTPYNHHSLLYHHQSPHISRSQSSVDLRNMSSRGPNGAYLVLPRSFGFPPLSSLNSRYMPPYIPSRGNVSPGYICSSSSQPNPQLHNESAASLSPSDLAQSPPGC